MDILRGWNERSFLGWKYWWLRVAGIGSIAAVLQGIWSATPFSLYLVSVWTLGLGALLLAVGRIIAWAGKIPPRGALAGILRYAPLVLFVPIIDALARAFHATPNGSVWWVAPSGLVTRFLLAGCGLKTCYSPGLTLLSVFIPMALGWLFIRLGWKWGKAIGLAFLGYLLFWMVLSVPSFTAWTRLSTYGTTLAAPNQIVEQAFNRTWSSALWSANRESFWSLPSVGNQSGRILIGSVFLWLLCFGLLAPLLGRSQTSREAWQRRLHQGAFILPPLALGALLGFKPIVGSFWMSSWTSAVFFISEAIVVWKAVTFIDDQEVDSDTRWLTISFAFIGAWLLGWPTASALAVALLIRWWAKEEGMPLHERAFALAASSWFLMLASWSLFARADWGSIPRGIFFGLFVFLLGLSVWNEYRVSILEQGTDVRLFGTRGPMMSRVSILGTLAVSLMVLWFFTGSLELIWVTATLITISASILWLFSQVSRNVVLFTWFSMILMGIMLRSVG